MSLVTSLPFSSAASGTRCKYLEDCCLGSLGEVFHRYRDKPWRNQNPSDLALINCSMTANHKHSGNRFAWAQSSLCLLFCQSLYVWCFWVGGGELVKSAVAAFWSLETTVSGLVESALSYYWRNTNVITDSNNEKPKLKWKNDDSMGSAELRAQSKPHGKQLCRPWREKGIRNTCRRHFGVLHRSVFLRHDKRNNLLSGQCVMFIPNCASLSFCCQMAFDESWNCPSQGPFFKRIFAFLYFSTPFRLFIKSLRSFSPLSSLYSALNFVLVSCRHHISSFTRCLN